MTSFVVPNAPNTLKHYQNALKRSKCKRECLAIGASAFSAYRSAYLEHQKPDLHLQRTMRFQFHVFRQLVSKALDQEGDITVQKTLMEMMQHLCEDHHSGLQDFVSSSTFTRLAVSNFVGATVSCSERRVANTGRLSPPG